MNIIFLDVDGVLLPLSGGSFNMSKSCLSNLKEILDETDAKIIFSSSWRTCKNDTALFFHELRQADIDVDLVHDTTPDLIHLSSEFWNDD